MAVEIRTGNVQQESTEITVYVCMKPGKFDAKLRWPFTGKVTVELLNQLEDKQHLESELFVEGIQRGEKSPFSAMLPFSDLKRKTESDQANTQYLKDDKLYFRVSAEATSHKSWLECTDNNLTK